MITNTNHTAQLNNSLAFAGYYPALTKESVNREKDSTKDLSRILFGEKEESLDVEEDMVQSDTFPCCGVLLFLPNFLCVSHVFYQLITRAGTHLILQM